MQGKCITDKTLLVIDIQNNITKKIISNINSAVDCPIANDIHIVYIKHNNLSAGARKFKPNTRGAELVPDMKIVSENIFVKSKRNALISEAFAAFINDNGFTVHILSNCITSYDKKKIPEMLYYY